MQKEEVKKLENELLTNKEIKIKPSELLRKLDTCNKLGHIPINKSKLKTKTTTYYECSRCGMRYEVN